MMRILVIEDEAALLESVVRYLNDSGYKCFGAANCSRASEMIWDEEYGQYIIDVMLPDGSGLELIKEIKGNQPESGIIIISAKDSLEDKLAGLDLGADDYITKPFYLAELNSRLKALERRRFRNGSTEIKFNEITINPDRNEVSVDGKLCELTVKERQLLEFFIYNKNKVVSKENIAAHLWDSDPDFLGDMDFIYTHIRNIRKKIKDCGGRDYIKTIYRLGYKWASDETDK